MPAHKKFSGQRIEFNPCKIATTACQAVVYEIRFTFFFFFFSLSIQEYQGYEIDLTYLRTYGTFDASVLLTWMLFCSFCGMSVHFVFQFAQVPHNFPSKDGQSEDEVSSLHFLIFKL